jgi:hypothetical protein
VITEGTAKGHDLKVDSQTLMEIKQAAEQQPDGRLKTKLNHRSGVDAVFGYLSDFRVEGPKLLADLHMLKSHDKFEQTWEQLETLPNAIGLSVAFAPGKDARCSRTGMKLARCSEILSADLVPEPAANPTGLFEAKVDSQINLNMNDAQDQGGADQSAGSVSNEQIFELLQQLSTRLEGVEQFQAAIQQELENADADGDQAAEGDDGNESFQGAAEGDNADGGTRQNNGHNPQAAAAGAPTGLPPAVAAEFAAMKKTITMLERKGIEAQEEAERVEFESAVEVLQNKFSALTEFAEKTALENETLRKTLMTGTKPVKVTYFEEKTTDKNSFSAIVQARMSETNPVTGKKFTRGEATLFAVKENPAAHRAYLERGGVQLTTLD